MVVGWPNVLTQYCLITEVKLGQAKSLMGDRAGDCWTVRYMTHRAASVRLSCHKYKSIVPGATELNINGSSYVYTIVPAAPS